jgi:hypothetical protein
MEIMAMMDGLAIVCSKSEKKAEFDRLFRRR